MSKGKDESIEDKEIQDLTTKLVKDLLKLKASKISGEEFDKLIRQANLGMRFVRDREMMKRISSSQFIRVITLVSSDMDERKKYIEASLPDIPFLLTGTNSKK